MTSFPRDYEYWKRVLENERLPAVVVDLEVFDRNIARLAAQIPPTKKLRLATFFKSMENYRCGITIWFS